MHIDAYYTYITDAPTALGLWAPSGQTNFYKALASVWFIFATYHLYDMATRLPA